MNNFGPVRLPPGTDGTDSGAFRPIVLANDDTTLLVSSTTNEILYHTENVAGGIIWTLGNLGSTRFTTTRLSPDGDVAYFGKANTLNAINLDDESQLWGVNGFVHPSNTPSDSPTLADFSLSSTGEYLYYCRSGASISGLRIADLVPTAAPVVPTSTPSYMPSPASSTEPSESSMPSTSIHPTRSNGPTIDPEYIPPSLSPTLMVLPSAMPSLVQSGAPSTTPTLTSSPSGQASPVEGSSTSSPTTSPIAVEEGTPTSSPVTKQVSTAVAPTSSPSGAPNSPTFTQPTVPPPPSANPPSAAAELPDDTIESESSTSLSTAAIIGIAVGGGVGLILIIGMIYYALKKKNDDDGVDRNWQASNETSSGNPGRQEDGTTFQYGDEEHNAQSNQRWGQGELRW